MEFPKWIRELPSEQHQFLSYHLKAKDCDVYFSELEAGVFNPDHTHENTVLNFVAEGSVTIVINGISKTYNVGSWCEIPKSTVHSLKAEAKSRLIEFWLK